MPQGAASLKGVSFEQDDPIWIANPDEGGRSAGTFLAAGEPADAEIDPALGVARDIAWVRYDDGARAGDIAKVFYRELTARKNTL